VELGQVADEYVGASDGVRRRCPMGNRDGSLGARDSCQESQLNDLEITERNRSRPGDQEKFWRHTSGYR
jgi:hypothetical protein